MSNDIVDVDGFISIYTTSAKDFATAKEPHDDLPYLNLFPDFHQSWEVGLDSSALSTSVYANGVFLLNLWWLVGLVQ